MIVTRFAPSPTGFLHVGHLRTALFGYALAKHNKGRFILRIEDTDKKREKEGSVENIIKTCKLFKIFFDEGPVIGGPNEPYLQSQRLDIYKEKAEWLVDNGYAYYCFCTHERLEQVHKEQLEKKLQPKYDGHCREIKIDEAKARIAKGEKYVIRLKVPANTELTVKDEILGEITWNTDNVDDQVLLKTDGFPTYHLAVVTDDVMMGVTHITRGFEWLASVPKHLLLFKAFGYPVPVMAHLPLILDPQGGKLSKRKGSVSTEEFMKEGYLTEALLNFIMLLGWSPPLKVEHGEKEREIFSLNEFIELFELSDLNKANPVFNREKLLWFNQKYIQLMTVDELQNRFTEWIKFTKFDDPELITGITSKGPDYLNKILELEHTRIKLLSEIPGAIRFYYIHKGDADFKACKHTKALTDDQVKEIIKMYKEILESGKQPLEKINHETWESNVRAIADKLGVKAGSVFMLLRLVVTDVEFSPPLFEVMQILGTKEVIARLIAYS